MLDCLVRFKKAAEINGVKVLSPMLGRDGGKGVTQLDSGVALGSPNREQGLKRPNGENKLAFQASRDRSERLPRNLAKAK